MTRNNIDWIVLIERLAGYAYNLYKTRACTTALASPAMGHWDTCPPPIDLQLVKILREQVRKMYKKNAILRNFYQFLAHFCHFSPQFSSRS